jgi:hypothetical protein
MRGNALHAQRHTAPMRPLDSRAPRQLALASQRSGTSGGRRDPPPGGPPHRRPDPGDTAQARIEISEAFPSGEHPAEGRSRVYAAAINR